MGLRAHRGRGVPGAPDSTDASSLESGADRLPFRARPQAARRRFAPATMRWRVTSALILAAVLFCGGAVTVTLARGTIAGKGAANGGQFPGNTAIAAAAAARAAAAAWMARQIASAAI